LNTAERFLILGWKELLPAEKHFLVEGLLLRFSASRFEMRGSLLLSLQA